MKRLFFILLLFQVAFSALVLNRVWASWHVRWGDFERAVAIEPWEWAHHIKAGGILVATGKPAESIPYFRRANRLMPYAWSPVNNLAIAHGMTGDLETAERMIEELLKIWPTNPVIMQNRDVVKRLKQ